MKFSRMKNVSIRYHTSWIFISHNDEHRDETHNNTKPAKFVANFTSIFYVDTIIKADNNVLLKITNNHITGYIMLPLIVSTTHSP